MSWLAPPQSLWSHGYCDTLVIDYKGLVELRLNLFGVTGTATPWGQFHSTNTFSASISLESRVLRPWPKWKLVLYIVPPQSLWSHGYCDNNGLDRCDDFFAASISLESRVLRPAIKFHTRILKARLNLFGVTGTATQLSQMELRLL